MVPTTDLAQIVRCELDVTDPQRIAIGVVDPTESHVFYLPLEQARALARQLLHLTGGERKTSFDLPRGMSWEDGQCR